MSVLLIRLAGPMQSWGTQSRFTVRDTGLEPSRSGVVGLLCAALGRPRDEPLDDFSALSMGVRVDREGELRRDFHTAGGGTLGGRPYGVAKASGAKGETVVSERFYLADADFLVAVAGDAGFLKTLDDALARPVWPLSLGRKAFVPGRRVRIPDGLLDGDEAEAALRRWPWERPPRRPNDRRPLPPVRLVLETNDPRESDGARQDVPVSFARRDFTVRYVRTDWIGPAELAAIAVEQEVPCI